MEGAQRRAMAIPDFDCAPTRTGVMATITPLEKENYDGQRHQFIGQVQRVNVVLDDSLLPVRLFSERMLTMLFPIAVTVQIGNDQPVYKTEQ